MDFVSLEEKLIIELDGGQHNEKENKQDDEKRTAWLTKEGYRVLRFWNDEVMKNTSAVLDLITDHVHPHPGPLPSRERE